MTPHSHNSTALPLLHPPLPRPAPSSFRQRNLMPRANPIIPSLYRHPARMPIFPTKHNLKRHIPTRYIVSLPSAPCPSTSFHTKLRHTSCLSFLFRTPPPFAIRFPPPGIFPSNYTPRIQPLVFLTFAPLRLAVKI